MNDRIPDAADAPESAGVPPHRTPVSTMGQLFEVWSESKGRAIEVAPRTWQITAGVVNCAVIETDEGLVLVDTGMRHDGPELLRLIRTVTRAPLHTVVYTHAHIDHAFGHGPLLAEAARRGDPRPRIVAHRATMDRFRRYIRTAAFNTTLNARQSGGSRTWWPSQDSDVIWPDTLYDDALTLRIGGEELRLHHARAETDDATWVWMPGRRLVCVGDLWNGVCPNAGNPQKVQRYAEEWADAFEWIAALDAQVLIPGHSMPIVGAQVVRERLGHAAELLRHIVEHTLAGLNAGLRPDAILDTLRVPAHLEHLPYLRPLHDRPEFIAANVIRLYGGWWNGYAADLLPAPRERLAAALAELAGGADVLAERARAVLADDPQLACHLAELAALAEPGSRCAQQAAADAFGVRLDAEPSFMGRGIYRTAADAARVALAALDAADGGVR
ncbi:alkyl sulfatase dimerization domain-containing protein [Embleya sp. NPDC008237]|uniref:alkyl sulfatase dimerization domain-containing protein n=1 Tax=Embleya sp. NPDC008237 TaxID=3363978 RepID=UPI0036EF16EF